MVDHNNSEGLYNWVGIDVKVGHHIFVSPSPKNLDLVIVHAPEDQVHCTAGTHGKGANVF